MYGAEPRKQLLRIREKLVSPCDKSLQILQGKWEWGSHPMGGGAESSKGHLESISKAGRFGGEGLLKAQNRSWRKSLYKGSVQEEDQEAGKRARITDAS